MTRPSPSRKRYAPGASGTEAGSGLGMSVTARPFPIVGRHRPVARVSGLTGGEPLSASASAAGGGHHERAGQRGRVDVAPEEEVALLLNRIRLVRHRLGAG